MIDRLNAALAGRYRIERELGAGGMATVYLAADLKHDRKVALKVLKPELAAMVGAERFLAEIRTTANLQNPHILPLFDSGEADGSLFYVMPYIEGETLRNRLDREKQLPVDEAVRIATAIVGALEHAHQRGVVHRDIKPANILLHDGQPLLADFGIALAVGAGGSDRLTETGLSLGTPYYMSPEQAAGDQPVGPASDIYALAAILYEMLVGEAPFTGSTAQAILARIIAGEPASASKHRPSVPANVDGAIRKALQRVPADRFASAADFARALADPTFRYGSTDADSRPGAGGARRYAAAMVVALAALAMGLVVGRATAGGGAAGGSTGAEVLRFDLPVDPSGGVAWLGSLPAIRYGAVPHNLEVAISPDGTTLAYTGYFASAEEGVAHSALYLRRLDRRSADVLAREDWTAEGASDPPFILDPPRHPFFSPDGTHLGYLSAGALRRRSLVDGEVETIYRGVLEEGARAGFAWTDDGEILFISEGRLMRVPDVGGEPTPVELGLPEGRRPAHPHPVQGTSLVLFSSLDFSDGPYVGEVRAVDLESGEQWRVMDDAMDPAVVDGRYLVFMRAGTLMAATFDAGTGRATGAPVAMVDSVMHSVRMPNTGGDTGTGQYTVSRTGHLIYASGGVYPLPSRSVIRRVAGGRVDTLDVAEGAWIRPGVDRQGRRLVLNQGARDVGWQLFVHDLERGVTQPLGGDLRTAVPGAAWNPQGTELAYNPAEGGVARISTEGEVVPLSGDWEARCAVTEWAATGEIVCLSRGELFALDPDSGTARQLRHLPAAISHPAVSPDGRWVAYVNEESGERQVYVSPFRDEGPPWLVSVDGGISPVWSPDGTEIRFRRFPQTPEFWSARVVDDGASISTSRPEPWFDGWPSGVTVPRRGFDLGPDGSIYAVVDESLTFEQIAVPRLQVYLNFAADLERRLGR